jgi:hypothetical protein
MTSRPVSLILVALLVLGSSVGVESIGAQVVQGPLPTPKECASDIAALALNPKSAIYATSAQACGAAGGVEIASVLARSHHESDTSFLAQLVVVSSLIQDRLVYTAALDLARDRSASAAARGAAFLTLLGQYTLNIGLRQRSPDLLGGVVPVTCALRAGETVPHFGSAAALPANFAMQSQTVAASTATDLSAPPLVREIAGCVAEVLPRPPVDLSGVRLTYVCDTDFNVHNPTSSALEFTYEVVDTTETGGITVPSHSDAVLSATGTGAVRLSYQSRVIQTASNIGSGCP